jgi:DNA invertase Pin-like site-specific DNA recombinase
MSKHIAIYCRVSSKRQDHRSQLADLEAWGASQTLPVVWYRDSATGRNEERPGWQKLRSAIERGEVETVACWRLDRLGRSAKGLTALFDDLQTRGVNLVSLKESLDLSNAAGRLVAHVLASVAHFETELRLERILAGQAAARSAGKTWGGRKPGTRIKVTVEKERMIRRLHKAGESIAAIARATELSRPTVYAALSE